MAVSTTKSYFWLGARDGAPFVLVAIPFGLLFGVLATEAGLDLVQTMVFTATVFAGAAQFTALQLMQEHAPTLVVIVSALAVNLRVAMYSASLTPHIGGAPLWLRAVAAYFIVDQTYACSMLRYETDPNMSLSQKLGYFFGVITPIAPCWYGSTLAGAVLGTQIPDSIALDFALPIAFLSMIAPMLRTPAHRVAALVASVVALLAAGIPFNLGLIVGAIAGMVAGVQTELWLERREGLT